jgi:hypothetical protein
VPDSLITQDMRSILGKTLETVVSYPVSASDIRKWATAVYYPDPPPAQYCDEEYAATTRHGGIVAPDEFNPFAWGARSRELAVPREGLDDGPTKPEERAGVSPPATSHTLNGGLEYEFSDVPVRPGDVITSTSAIVEYKEREGRLGLMLFTTIETRYVNQRDELVRAQRMTLIRY